VSKQEQDSALGVDQPRSALGELATGASGRWHVSIDESLDAQTSYYLELDGPTAYLCVRLRELSAVERLRQFLEVHSPRETLSLGQLADLSVWLVWDDEDFIRCFLVVGEQNVTTLRLSLDGDDVRMLAEALKQAAEDLLET
jgi:hypothetical protein